MKKITIGGLSGTGTSTIGRKLAEKLNIPFMSGGDFFKELAKENNMTIEEFDKFTHDDFSFDYQLDKKQKEFSETHNAFVLESRLGWFNVPESFKIKLFCEDDIRFSRTSKIDKNRIATIFDSFEKTKSKGLEREETHRHRIEKIYGIMDLNDDSHYDIVIDTSNKTPEEIIDSILEAVR